jgi:puromycin-sensitive aminopeptidase
MAKKVTRLYGQFAPEKYKLEIKISEDKESFSGKAIIAGRKTGRPSSRITLHQKDLKILSSKIINWDKKGNRLEIPIKRTVLHNSLDELRLHSEANMYPGNYEIELDFSGKITLNMDGVYPCFFEHNGQKKKLIATQFESHHAREAFPCIDEPEAKAVFEFSLTHAKSETALSNTPAIKETKDGQSCTTIFAPTPIMSTYLLAFVVGELESKQTTSKNGVLIRTFATADQIEHSKFALDVAVKCMDFYEDYYDIPFPLPKCDFVALPDFASGAMENWGLITFREQALLYDPKNTSKSTKQWVALVVAHELTHQWFGNLVTMRWWTDLWLNEGFASWMEYLAIDSLYPEWHLWTQFTTDEQQLALKLDALEHTHPIEVEVKHPDEIRTIFDAISYQKGASVIHMLQHYLGAEGFRDGLRHYLKTHSYSNTDTVDLWQALEEVTNKPVKDFMGAWTSQSGFPIIQVEQKSDYLIVKQSRFVANPSSTARSQKVLWPIPLLAKNLNKQTALKKINNIPFLKQPPLMLNVGQTGFYRVNYSHEMQTKQIKAIELGEVSDTDRMGLLSDSFETMKAGYQPVSEYLELLEHYQKESSLSSWEVIASSIGAIRSTLSKNDHDNELRDLMKPYVQKLVETQIKRLGWDESPNESHLDTLLRPLVLGIAAASDEPKIVEKSLVLYQDKVEGKNHINPDLRGIIYSTAARKGGQKQFDELLKMYINSKSSDEKLSITAGMTSFEQSEIHTQILELFKSDTIRTQDLSYWIAYSMMNRYSRLATWQWLKENWDWLKQKNGTDLSFSRMPIYAARNFASKELLDDYQNFFSSRMEPLIERAYLQGLEMIETSTAWRMRDSEKAHQWFKARQK